MFKNIFIINYSYNIILYLKVFLSIEIEHDTREFTTLVRHAKLT